VSKHPNAPGPLLALYERLMHRSFSPELVQDVNGVDLNAVDELVFDIGSSYVMNTRPLTREHHEGLSDASHRLDGARSSIPKGPAADHFERVRDLTSLLLSRGTDDS
jgi:hypothetical protein